MCSPKKSGRILSGILHDQRSREDFYEYTSRLRKETDYYLNMAKIKKLWMRSDHPVFNRVVRVLSQHYLRWSIPLSILTSKKMSPQSRMFHLKSRKELIYELANLV